MYKGLAGLFINQLIDCGEMETLEQMGQAVRDASWIELLEKQMWGRIDA